ncbi:MAG: lactate racemization operon protein LarA, partial [Spirochaetaceae bacterium]|nr:lactate racemization operon protein LarA [Spirochaetaceae bacterium]
TGNLEGNPLHKDMIYAAETAGLAFILNVVLDEEKRIVHAVAGHFDKAHRAGCTWLSGYVRVPRSEGDIVVTTNGGYPLDQNVYQAVKGMTAAESCCREGGVIIMVAACAEGHGGEAFYSTLKDAESPAALYENVMRIPPEKTLPDQWEYQILSRILTRFKVILVTDMADHEMIRDMKIIPAADMETAMSLAREHCSVRGITDPEIVVIPDGVGVVIE